MVAKRQILKRYIDLYKNQPGGIAGLDNNNTISLTSVFPEIVDPENRNSIVYENNKWTGKTLESVDTNSVALAEINVANGVAGLDGTGKLAVSLLPPIQVSQLADTQLSTLGDNQVLMYDINLNKWKNTLLTPDSTTGLVPQTRLVNGRPLSTDIVLNSTDTDSVPLTRSVNGKALSSDIILTAADTNSVPIVRSINGYPLSSDVILTSADTNSVPLTRTVNGKPLSSNVILTSADTSSVPLTRTVNGRALSTDISLSAQDVSAVPVTRSVNGRPLTSDIVLTAADVSAIDSSLLNVPNGVAGLNSSGKIGMSALPSLSLESSLMDVEMTSPLENDQALVYDTLTNSWKNNTLNFVSPFRTINNQPLTSDVTLTAADVSALGVDLLNVANGVAGLDPSGKISTSNLPAIPLASLDDVQFSGLTTNHTLVFDGTQWTNSAASGVSSTINGYSLSSNIVLNAADVQAIPLAEKNAANGVAGLDASSRLTVAQLPTSTLLSTQVNVANGVAGLDAGSRLLAAQIPTNVLLSSQINVANGVAGLNASSKLPISSLPDLPFSSSLFTDLLISSPIAGQVMTYNGSRWVNTSSSSGGSSVGGAELFSQIIHSCPHAPEPMLVGVTKDNKRVYYVSRNVYSWTRLEFVSATGVTEPSTSVISKITCDNDSGIYVLFNSGNLWIVTVGGVSDGEMIANVFNFWICERLGIQQSRRHQPIPIFINSNNTALQCRGANEGGWFGLGNTTTQASFTTISTTTFAPNNIRNLWHFNTNSPITGFTIIQTTDFRIWFAGNNTNGVFGRGNTTDSTSFVDVTSNWGNLFLPIENVVVCGEVLSSNVSFGCLIHRKNGSVDVLHQSGNINGAVLTTATNVPLTFLQANETITQLTFTGTVSITPRVFLVTSLGNLYMRYNNTIGTALVNFTLVDTGISRILADKITSTQFNSNSPYPWYNVTGVSANRWLPSLAIKNGFLSLAGTAGPPGYYGTVKPGIIGTLPSTTFARCKLQTIVPDTPIVSGVLWHHPSEYDLIPTFFANINAIATAWGNAIYGQGVLNMIVLDAEGYLYSFFNMNSSSHQGNTINTHWPHYKTKGVPPTPQTGGTVANTRVFVPINPFL